MHPPMKSAKRSVAAVALSALALMGACGSDDPAVDDAQATTTTSGPEAVFPVTVTAANGQVTIAQRPTHIVSLAPAVTEMLFAIDAGEQVTAVDDQSNYPDGVPTTKLSGFEPNLEAIVGAKPDLVVISNDPGSLASGLGAAKIPVLLMPAATTIDDTYGEIAQLGQATGHVAEAEALVDKMRTDIDRITRTVGSKGKGLTYYHELDNTYYSVTSKTFLGALYGALGLENIADEAGKGSEYPQLSAEFIVKSDPDLIFLADTKCCKQSAATVKARPGFSELTAVKNGNVVELDDDVASRWGPRVVDLLEDVAAAVERAGAAKAAA
ncbi:MAG TPA: ABC transporter substrate-binding protein [Acidimicrobiales bacterium]|nr:ABC transporter substrate-binding protein [Acidimicrobiales bacterium]